MGSTTPLGGGSTETGGRRGTRDSLPSRPPLGATLFHASHRGKRLVDVIPSHPPTQLELFPRDSRGLHSLRGVLIRLLRNLASLPQEEGRESGRNRRSKPAGPVGFNGTSTTKGD